LKTVSAAPSESGIIENGEHVLALRVYYEDTDAGGIVYHANYLKYAERARTEMLRLIGISQREWLAREGLAFAVRDLAIDYLRPARLDDGLAIRSRLLESRGATLTLEQRIGRVLRDAGIEEELARLRVRVACIRTDGRAARLPLAIREAFAVFGPKGEF
jgi:acyl-CoA thioester hydrolase